MPDCATRGHRFSRDNLAVCVRCGFTQSHWSADAPLNAAGAVQCSHKLRQEWSALCSRPASIWWEGKWYCPGHAP